MNISFKYPYNWEVKELYGRTTMSFIKNSINIWDESGFFGGYSSSPTLKEIAEKEIAFYRGENKLKKGYSQIEQHEFILKWGKIYLIKAMYMSTPYIPFLSFNYISIFLENNVIKPFKIECTFPFAHETKYASYFEQFIKT